MALLLTQCAACAAPLGLTLGKKCGRCSTRYCGPECQVQHWKEGGHDQLCKPIKKAGGAEQYNANKKYAEALAVAVEKCAEDTKGQTCYICTQALHWKTKEGLVRMCACRGTAGFAHVSCLAEQAKILVAEAEENNLEVFKERWDRWQACSLCEQKYHGVVACALGWACWKTYLARPEAGGVRIAAMSTLGNGLSEAYDNESALPVMEAELDIRRRLGDSDRNLLTVLGNLASTYSKMQRFEEALPIRRDVYSRTLRLQGEESHKTLISANNLASSLVNLQRFKEAKGLLLKTLPVARRVLGENEETRLRMGWYYAVALYQDDAATLDELREAVTTLEETAQTARRVLGGAHPLADAIEETLRNAREVLSARAEKEELMEKHDVTAEVIDAIARFAVKKHQVSVLGTTVEGTYAESLRDREAVEAMTPGDA